MRSWFVPMLAFLLVSGSAFAGPKPGPLNEPVAVGDDAALRHYLNWLVEEYEQRPVGNKLSTEVEHLDEICQSSDDGQFIACTVGYQALEPDGYWFWNGYAQLVLKGDGKSWNELVSVRFGGSE